MVFIYIGNALHLATSVVQIWQK